MDVIRRLTNDLQSHLDNSIRGGLNTLRHLESCDRLGEWILLKAVDLPNSAGREVKYIYLHVYKGIPYVGSVTYMVESGSSMGFYVEGSLVVSKMAEWQRGYASGAILRYLLNHAPRQCWKVMGVDPDNPYDELLMLAMKEGYESQ